jgi:hypothetical protein
MFYKKSDPTKTPVTIVDDKDTFYQLSDGQMIKKDIFLKYYISTEQQINENININNNMNSMNNLATIDVNSFFNKPAIIINENDIVKLKNIDPSKIVDGIETEVKTHNPYQQNTSYNDDSPIIKQVEKLPIPNNTKTDVSQYKVYDNDDDAYDDFVNKQNGVQQTNNQPKFNVDDYDAALLGKTTQQPSQQLQTRKTEQQIDPSEMMFKSFKRNHNITINIEIKDKIANPEFIKLMMENIEGDIVSYYKKLIMNNIMNNIEFLENKVEAEIKKSIYGDEKKKRQHKQKIEKKTENITEEIITEVKEILSDENKIVSEINLIKTEEIIPKKNIKKTKKSE